MKTLTVFFVLGSILSATYSQAAFITGSLAAQPGLQTNADLTALGTEDWAIWGYGDGGTSTSLAPDVSMSGGSGISSLTYINPNSQPLRGLGQYQINFTFSWNNGNTTPSATQVFGGLQVAVGAGPGDGAGEGFSFTVPAGTAAQQLSVYVDQLYGTGQLTATLSDGSAPSYVDTSLPFGNNSPGIYTIDFAAASAGQTLTVQWMETSAEEGETYDNPAIYAAALSPIPEPQAAAVAAIGGAFLFLIRRRQ